MPRGRRRRFGRGEPPVTPLCVVLLPGWLGDAALRERADDLVSAPGAVAVEPAALGYGATGHLPRLLRERLAAGQARRMALPGRMRAVMVFAPSQYPLARALLAVHPDSELWYADPGRTPPERWAEEHRAALGRAA